MFFNAAGVESPGLTSSPAIAVYLAEMITDKLNAKKKDDFNPIRKGIPKFREMTDEQRAKAISVNPDYAKVVCRCETVTEAEIREAIRRPVGARSVDGIKRRTRAGMGRCQAGFCTPRTVEILCEELHISPLEVTKFGGNSKYLEGYLFEKGDHGINMARGFKEVEKKLADLSGKDIGSILKAVGMSLVSTVGGASGPLYGTAFMKAGAAVGAKNEMDGNDFIAALEAAIGGIEMRGKAHAAARLSFAV